jgi:hypothetical protein
MHIYGGSFLRGLTQKSIFEKSSPDLGLSNPDPGLLAAKVEEEAAAAIA